MPRSSHNPVPLEPLIPRRLRAFESNFRKLPFNACWLWKGARVVNKAGNGYGVFGNPPRLSHRISYTQYVGPIPPGLTLDHVCHTTGCVNPAHLEPATFEENTRRGAPGQYRGGVKSFAESRARHKIDEKHARFRHRQLPFDFAPNFLRHK